MCFSLFHLQPVTLEDVGEARDTGRTEAKLWSLSKDTADVGNRDAGIHGPSYCVTRSDCPNSETRGLSTTAATPPAPPRDVRPCVETFSGERAATGSQRVEARMLHAALQCRARRPTEIYVGPTSVGPRRTDPLTGTVGVLRRVLNLRGLVAVEGGAADREVLEPGSCVC